ncbi:MAG: hypothetical protein C4542_08445 [Dehalococcoidia bacterium]|nr:MAG: hypothetical protein C4542_08445 [Dehalococcoidia bacterium]
MPKPPVLTARDVETLKTLNRCVVMTTAQLKEAGGFRDSRWYHYKRLKVLEKRGYIRRSGEYLELTRKGVDIVAVPGESEPVKRPKTRQDRTKLAALSRIHIEMQDWEFLPGGAAKRQYRLNRGDRLKGVLRKNEEIAVYVLSDKPTARTVQRVRQEISLLWRVRIDSALVLCPTVKALEVFGDKALALKRLMVLPYENGLRIIRKIFQPGAVEELCRRYIGDHPVKQSRKLFAEAVIKVGGQESYVAELMTNDLVKRELLQSHAGKWLRQEGRGLYILCFESQAKSVIGDFRETAEVVVVPDGWVNQ